MYVVAHTLVQMAEHPEVTVFLFFFLSLGEGMRNTMT